MQEPKSPKKVERQRDELIREAERLARDQTVREEAEELQRRFHERQKED